MSFVSRSLHAPLKSFCWCLNFLIHIFDGKKEGISSGNHIFGHNSAFLSSCLQQSHNRKRKRKEVRFSKMSSNGANCIKTS